MDDRFVIDEADFKDIKSLNGATEVVLANSLRIEADPDALCGHLLTVSGTDKVEILDIEAFSCLKNVEILKAFPNLRTLIAGGSNITSLDGLEMFKNGVFINICTGNKKRDIAKISETHIRSMYLEYKMPEDFDAIKNCGSLDDLVISKCPEPDFHAWKDVPLTYLKFWNYGKFTELHDTASVKTLEWVMIGACQRFERFTGDNSNIKRLTIDGCPKFEGFGGDNLNPKTLIIATCKRFDVRSLESLRNLEYLCVNDCASEIALSELPALPNLRTLQLWTCKVNYDIFDLKKKFPKLEEFWPSRIKKDQAVSLSKANTDVVVKYKQQKYVNGCLVPE